MAETVITPSAQNDVHTSGDSVPPTKIRINISGTLFQCRQSMFSTFPSSRLANLAAYEDKFDTGKKEYFFDKDPFIFNSILDAYRTGVIHAPNEVCGERFQQEVMFWGLPISTVAPCCWKDLHEANTNLCMMNLVTDAILQSVDVGFSSDGQLTSRQKLWLFIEKPNSSRMAWVWAVTIAAIVSSLLLCTLAVSTVDGTESNLYWLEFVSYLFITAEICACLFSCQNWRELLRNWMHWAEVLSCTAFWIVTFVEKTGLDYGIASAYDARCLKIVRLVRVLRVFRLVRVLRVCTSIEEFRIICVALRASIWNIFIFVSMYAFVTFIFSVLFYVASMHSEWPVIENVFHGMYLAIITATTVGYGDVFPEFGFGYVVSGMCALSGIFSMTIFFGGFVIKYGRVDTCFKLVRAHIRELQRLAPDGELIRLRVNDPSVLMTSNGCMYSFKTVPVP